MRLTYLILIFLLAINIDTSDAVNEDYNKGLPKIISAEGILFNISRGINVNYDNVTINGNLDLRDIPLNTTYAKVMGRISELKVIYSGLKLTNSTINGDLHLENTKFQEHVDLSGSNFNGDAYFTSSILQSGADLRSSHFHRGANFAQSTFVGNTCFDGTEFDGDETTFGGANFNESSFVGSIFSKNAILRGCRFKENAYFNDARFDDRVDFSNSIFSGGGNFRGAHFLGDVDFSGVEFNRSSEFENTIFLGTALFDSVHFVKACYPGEIARFKNAYFSQDADFYNSTFYTDASFVRSKFDKDASFEDIHLRGSISLNGSRFSRLMIDWASLDGHLLYDGTAYLALIKNFKDIERFNDADECYYAYRRESQSQKDLSAALIYDWIALITCGYGVRLRLTISWVFIVIGVFAGAYYFGGGVKLKEPGKEDERTLSPMESLYFSVMVFTSQKPDDLRPSGRYKYLVMTERLMGWFLMALFLTVLVAMLIRQR